MMLTYERTVPWGGWSLSVGEEEGIVQAGGTTRGQRTENRASPFTSHETFIGFIKAIQGIFHNQLHAIK